MLDGRQGINSYLFISLSSRNRPPIDCVTPKQVTQLPTKYQHPACLCVVYQCLPIVPYQYINPGLKSVPYAGLIFTNARVTQLGETTAMVRLSLGITSTK